jgi:hypothetical protein
MSDVLFLNYNLFSASNYVLDAGKIRFGKMLNMKKAKDINAITKYTSNFIEILAKAIIYPDIVAFVELS